ncbi:MAG: Ig-like domain-containing protein, partial [Candidatus Hydrothermarchaeales archaeon]
MGAFQIGGKILPENNMNFVPLDAPIDIFFHTSSIGNEMNKVTVEGNLTITANGTTVICSAGNCSINWTTMPSGDVKATIDGLTLAPFSQYNISLNGGEDTAGNTVQVPLESVFTTGDESFGEGHEGGGSGGGGAGQYIGNIWVDSNNAGDPCTPDGTAKADFNGWCNDNNVESGAGFYYIGVGFMQTGNASVYVNNTFIETIDANTSNPWHTTNTAYLTDGNNNVSVNYTNNLQTIFWNIFVGVGNDSTPPNVTMAPSNGSQNIPTVFTMKLFFTEPINTSTMYPPSLLNFSFTLRDDPSTSITPTGIEWSPDNKSIKISIPVLNSSTWYKVEVNGTDMGGNALLNCPCTSEFQTGASGEAYLYTGEGLDFSAGKNNASNNDLDEGSLTTNNSAKAMDMGSIPLDHIETCPDYSTYNISYAVKNSSWYNGSTYCIYTREGGYAKINILVTTTGNTNITWFYNASGNSFPGGDKDHDGVPDTTDYCPDEPGDPSGAKPGCPSNYGTDSDADGIPDAEDQCPYEKGYFNYGGCKPDDVTGDTDFDGIPDDDDDCDYEFGFPSPTSGQNGCPVTGDSDNDGIPDTNDACPFSRGPHYTGGCPVEGGDKDFDGIPDDVDQCPTEGGPPFTGGCPSTDHFGSGNDTDMDGVPNSDDKCPSDPGPPFTAGCPTTDVFGAEFTDKDMDGIPDIDDNCPTQAGPHMNRGCPLSGVNDTDVDGIPDTNDDCPKLAGPMFLGGCPMSNMTEFGAGFQDSDMDGVIDADDACPNLFGPPFFAGCPGDNSTGGLIIYGTGAISDSDNDGIPDSDDGCPSTFGPPFTGGCPVEDVFGAGFSDTDGDGVPDVDDACPKRAGAPFTGGCPLTNITGNSSFKDSDFDGTPDTVDDCPKEPGPPFTGGCP